ncbi:MAG: hypothetical protein ACJASQ_002932 [Crocinitomicaceae bacterium]|jgi:hypothetical protein
MSFTTGFLLLFFTIVIPGFLFLRAYFYGEFSKQFSPKENISRHLLFGLIPGSIIQISCFYFGKIFGLVSVDGTSLIAAFETINKQNINGDDYTKHLLDDPTQFALYLIIIYVFSFLIGVIISRLIRYLKLDKLIKILRFKNQWYYLFSGEIFEFKKFKSAANILGKTTLQDKEVQLAKVDVLISNGGSHEFYSGYVVDYDLCPNDPSKLENLYLMDAYRYEYKELKNVTSKFEHPRISERKHIPGEIFVLSMASLVNINISYLLSGIASGQEKQIRFALKTLNVIMILLLICCTYLIFFEAAWITFDWYTSFHAQNWWLDNLLLTLFSVSIVSFFVSTKNKETGNYEFPWKDFWINLIAFVVTGFVFFGVFYWL